MIIQQAKVKVKIFPSVKSDEPPLKINQTMHFWNPGNLETVATRNQFKLCIILTKQDEKKLL